MREIVVDQREPRLWAFGGGLKRAPSQKELALILHVTTRHLRRWEHAEAAADRRCSRPYSHADMWHLYQRRGGKGWNRPEATRLGLASIFESFDQIMPGKTAAPPQNERSVLGALMLRSIVAGENDDLSGTGSLPGVFLSGLADAARIQLRTIVDCDQARDVLVKAFFEAALIAEVKHNTIFSGPDTGAEPSAKTQWARASIAANGKVPGNTRGVKDGQDGNTPALSSRK